MPTRTKGGRTVVVSSASKRAEGRRAPLAIATRPRAELRNDVAAVARLVGAMLALAGNEPATRAQRRRPKDIRHQMARAGQGALAQAVTSALSADGGALLRMVATAHADFREPLYRACVRFFSIREEHEIRSTAADAELLRAVTADAFASAIAARIARAGFTAETPDLLRQMGAASAGSRLDLHSALMLAKQAADARGGAVQGLDLASAIKAAQARADAMQPPDDDEDDEDDEADDDETNPRETNHK